MNTRIDIANLLEPIPGASACGEDMEYTLEFAALQVAAAGKPEQQVGELIVPAAEPDWHDVIERATRLLAHTHDLRIACRLTQALLHVDGLPGLGAGLALVLGQLQTHWAELYPRLDAEDGHDPAIRVNAIALLCNVPAIVHPLRERPLLQSGLAGAISLRSIAQANGAEALDDTTAARLSAAEIDSAFEAIALPELQAIVLAAQQAHQCAAAIEAELARRVGTANALDFSALLEALAEVEGVAAPRLARRTPAVFATSAAEPHAEREIPAIRPALDPVARPEATCVDTPHATLSSRGDVLQALLDIGRYFEQHEPSHPVPVLLERARRWLAMDYMELLRDLAPEAAMEAEKLRGASH
jgi:type VI secretion system protein ImpA